MHTIVRASVPKKRAFRNKLVQDCMRGPANSSKSFKQVTYAKKVMSDV